MSGRFEMRGEHGPELEFPEAVEVRILRMRPGDTLVLILDNPVSDAEADRLRDRVKERFPDNPLLLLYAADLAVIRKEEVGDGDG